MGQKLSKFLNVITFGAINRSAKKKAQRMEQEKNSQLTLNTIELPDVEKLLVLLGNKENVARISTTISTIKFELYDINLVKVDEIKELTKKGIIKNANSLTLLIGDCAGQLKKVIEEKQLSK